jgi:hypothetical protein
MLCSSSMLCPNVIHTHQHSNIVILHHISNKMVSILNIRFISFTLNITGGESIQPLSGPLCTQCTASFHLTRYVCFNPFRVTTTLTDILPSSSVQSAWSFTSILPIRFHGITLRYKAILLLLYININIFPITTAQDY